MDETPLVGGNFSDATRVGDTVRRRSGPWTPTVHAFLRFLRAEGFDVVPEPIGIDERGREILRYIEGETHVGWPDPMPDWIYDEEVMVSAVRMLRRYHDISARFVDPPGAVWQQHAPTAREVICHFDWAPYDMVFSGHRPIAMLDWDAAGPGSRAWDVARAAFLWVPLKPADDRFPLPAKAARLRTLCEAYGLIDRAGLVELLREQLLHGADAAERAAAAGHPGWTKLVGWDIPKQWRADAEQLKSQKEVLESELS